MNTLQTNTRLGNSWSASYRTLRTFGVAALVCGLGLLSVACGGGHHDYEGDILVENRTDLGGAPDDLISFQISRFRDPFSANLLGGDLAPGDGRFIGTFDEDYYDATGELLAGDIIDWSDEYVGYERTTVFEAR